VVIDTRRTLRCAAGIAAVLALTLIFREIAAVNATTIGFTYLIAILLIAASWGLSESVLASITATICLNYFFLPPVGTWTIEDPENWVALVTFLISSLIASQLSDRANRRTLEAKARQIEMERLYALSRAILSIDYDEPIGSHIARELARICEIPAVAIYDEHTDSVYLGGSEEISHIQDKLRQTALTGAQSKEQHDGILLAPIFLGSRCIGSLGMRGGGLSLTALHALFNLVAISLENARSRQIATRAQAARQSEEFKSTLLDGLAHEFKTPLTSIKAAASALLTSVSDSAQRHELLTVIDQEAGRLSRLVTETTHLARIEAGKIQLRRQLHPISSMIDRVIGEMELRMDGRPVERSIRPDLPSVFMDIDLMQLAFKQLLDNAIKYSPPRSPIRITAEVSGANVIVRIHNSGESLSKPEQMRIFDKFYRGIHVRHKVAGTGMGLSIARDILVAHGGDIRLNGGNETGTEFVMTLPMTNGVIR
jgi:two-component system, OmpR family, sensor histidine kinase KdpD